MSTPGPASSAGRRAPGRVSTRSGPRPYPDVGDDARDVALAAVRALHRAPDPDAVRLVLATVVADLGGALVPARLEPLDALEPDVALGLGEPVLVVVDPLSVAELQLRQVLPGLLEDARAALTRLRQQEAEEPVGSGGVPPSALDRLLERVSGGDIEGARRLVLALVRHGVAPSALVEQLLAPAQVEVGERWYRGTWTIADEHAATAVTESCTAALPTSRNGPRVVVACPEGEWHTLPARLLSAGASVQARVLGPGLPAGHLERYLASEQPDALALSCTMSTNLLRAVESIAAAHRAGVPVVAGGRAFGRDPRRALHLGADAWAATPSALAAVSAGLTSGERLVDVPHEAMLADAVPDELLQLVLERHAAVSPEVARMRPEQRRHTLDDLRWVARHAAAALLCDDPSVLDDLVDWLDGLLTPRRVPRRVLADGLAYLADGLELETPQVAGLVRASAGRLATA